jgi:hypothetical protein
MSNVCQYITLYRLIVLCHNLHCCLLVSVHCLSVPHTVATVGFVSLCPLLFSTVCPLSLSTSHCTVCWFCVTMYIALFHNLSTLCLYLTLYRLLVMCHYVYCCLLESVHCLSLPKFVTSLGSLSLCPLLSSRVCPVSVCTAQCTVCLFCVTMSNAVF